jgi:hypothetical protein
MKKKTNLSIDTSGGDFGIDEYGSFVAPKNNYSSSPVVPFYSPSKNKTTSVVMEEKKRKEDEENLLKRKETDFLTPKTKKKLMSPKSKVQHIETLIGSLPLISPSLPEIVKDSPLFRNEEEFDFPIKKEEKKTKDSLILEAKKLKHDGKNSTSKFSG